MVHKFVFIWLMLCVRPHPTNDWWHKRNYNYCNNTVCCSNWINSAHNAGMNSVIVLGCTLHHYNFTCTTRTINSNKSYYYIRILTWAQIDSIPFQVLQFPNSSHTCITKLMKTVTTKLLNDKNTKIFSIFEVTSKNSYNIMKRLTVHIM